MDPSGSHWVYANTLSGRVSRLPSCIFPEFLIQYEDSLHHRGHWHNLTEVAGTKTTAHLKLSPYVHYTFRVLALNAVGYSQPSLPSRMFKTEAAGTNPPSLGFEFLIGASFNFFSYVIPLIGITCAGNSLGVVKHMVLALAQGFPPG